MSFILKLERKSINFYYSFKKKNFQGKPKHILLFPSECEEHSTDHFYTSNQSEWKQIDKKKSKDQSTFFYKLRIALLSQLKAIQIADCYYLC